MLLTSLVLKFLKPIYGRYIDILTQLNNPESEIKKEVSLSKLELLFFEVDNSRDYRHSNHNSKRKECEYPNIPKDRLDKCNENENYL